MVCAAHLLLQPESCLDIGQVTLSHWPGSLRAAQTTLCAFSCQTGWGLTRSWGYQEDVVDTGHQPRETILKWFQYSTKNESIKGLWCHLVKLIKSICKKQK